MTVATDLLLDGWERIRQTVHSCVDGLSSEDLGFRIDPEANSISWLVWHLTRVQDDHVAGVSGADQVWTGAGWFERFALPIDAHVIGYGDSSDDVAQLGGVGGDLLTGYYDAVHAASVEFIGTLTDDDLTRVVDRSWDPPVTMAVRLTSVLNDDLQHAGQASFLRGVLLRRD